MGRDASCGPTPTPDNGLVTVGDGPSGIAGEHPTGGFVAAAGQTEPRTSSPTSPDRTLREHRRTAFGTIAL